MNIKEIRRDNARALADSAGGVAQFAKVMGWEASSRASQVIGRNPTRNIGDRTAAEIERRFNKPAGWLDHPPGETGISTDLDDEALLLECMRTVRAEIRALNLRLDQEDEDELLVKATFILYRFSREAGSLLPAGVAITTARL